MTLRHLLPLALTITFLPTLRAQELLPLEACVRIALTEDLGRQIADRQLAIAANNNHGSLAGRLPQLALNANSQGSLANQDNPVSIFNGLIRSGNAQVSLDASWVVFEGFRARFSQDRLGRLEEQARIRLRDAGLQAVRRVTLAYLLAEWQQAQVSLAEEILRLSSDLYAYQELRRDMGPGQRQLLLQTRDAVLADSASLTLARLNLRTAIINLKLAMGQPSRESFQVGGALQESSETPSGELLRQRMLENNPALLLARMERELGRLQTQLRQAARYPRIALTTGAVMSGNVTALDGNNPFTGEPFGTRSGSNRNAYAGISFNMPLVDFGLRRRNVQEARLQETAALLAEANLNNELAARMSILTETARTQGDLYALSRAQEENARENLALARERYGFGQLSVFDLRTVQNAYALAAQRRLSALYNLKVTEVEMLALSGELFR
jgi:outer membrane protein